MHGNLRIVCVTAATAPDASIPVAWSAASAIAGRGNAGSALDKARA
jgi:hypothetical protein